MQNASSSGKQVDDLKFLAESMVKVKAATTGQAFRLGAMRARYISLTVSYRDLQVGRIMDQEPFQYFELRGHR